MNYRREIDGLRALAVLPVIFFHAGFDTFSGGFVGVDVFFVVSGYLITSIIHAEKQAGTFSLINFYERRVRRILPALFFVMAVCIPFAWLWLLPSGLKNFSQSLIAVSVFASNILFWRASGYFDIAAELKPLLHTWSLAVEEQFYVLFPVFLMLTWRLGKRWIVGLLLAIAIISLAVAHWGAFNMPEASFFLLPTRGWELLIGSFIAFYFTSRRSNHSQSISQLGSLIGLLLILYAVFAFNRSTPFPSLYALVPTIGAALVILFATPTTFVGKVLGSKAFVGVGLISYSAYLWHQPMIAFARHRSLAEPSVSLLSALSLSALVLAYFSWRFVEQPFRRRGVISRAQIFVFAAICSAIFVLLGFVGHIEDGFSDRLPPNLIWESAGAKFAKNGDICEVKAVENYFGVQACEFGDKNSERSILLYGDSHAQAMSQELNDRLIKLGVKGIILGLDGCSVVPQIYDIRNVTNLNDCEAKFQKLLSYIKATSSEVIVASRWTFRLFPTPGEIDQLTFVNSDGGRERETYREYVAIGANKVPSYEATDKRSALRHFIEGILSTGIKVYYVYPVPEIGWDIARLNMNHYSQKGATLNQISIDHKDFVNRNRFVNSVFAEFESNRNFVPIKPEAIFCDTFVKGRCVAQFDAIPFYYDDDHLSDVGEKYLVDKIFGDYVK